MSAAKRQPSAEALSPSPAKKRLRTDFQGYTLNVNLAVDKAYETKSLAHMADAPIAAVQGIAEKGAEALVSLGVKTVREFGCCKYYRWARAITTLAEREEDGKRAEDSVCNVDSAVVKAYEKKSLSEISQAPVQALQGVSEAAAEGLSSIFVTTVKDLAENKFAAWCDAIATLADAEVLDVENPILKELA